MLRLSGVERDVMTVNEESPERDYDKFLGEERRLMLYSRDTGESR
jgi:hypothetical protein